MFKLYLLIYLIFLFITIVSWIMYLELSFVKIISLKIFNFLIFIYFIKVLNFLNDNIHVIPYSLPELFEYELPLRLMASAGIICFLLLWFIVFIYKNCFKKRMNYQAQREFFYLNRYLQVFIDYLFSIMYTIFFTTVGCYILDDMSDSENYSEIFFSYYFYFVSVSFWIWIEQSIWPMFFIILKLSNPKWPWIMTFKLGFFKIGLQVAVVLFHFFLFSMFF